MPAHATRMAIALGADHRGADMLREAAALLEQQGHEVTCTLTCDDCSDYPDAAYPVAAAVAEGQSDCGILFCGSGIGMAIVANKVVGIRAAVVHDEITAERSRRHNNANVLCLPADLIGRRDMLRIVERWLNTGFDGGRHERRVAKITEIERREMGVGTARHRPVIGEITRTNNAVIPASRQLTGG